MYRTPAFPRVPSRPQGVIVEAASSENGDAARLVTVVPLPGLTGALFVAQLVGAVAVCVYLGDSLGKGAALAALIAVTLWIRFLGRVIRQRVLVDARGCDDVRVDASSTLGLRTWRVAVHVPGCDVATLVGLNRSQARFLAHVLRAPPDDLIHRARYRAGSAPPRLVPPRLGSRRQVACGTCESEFDFGLTQCPHCKTRYSYRNGAPRRAPGP